MLLSIIIPCYNEETTIEETIVALERLSDAVAASGIHVEIVAVDDASTDGTLARLQACALYRDYLSVLPLGTNGGKGSAVKAARPLVHGDVVVIQDADLEYDPLEIPRLIEPILDGHADAVLGTRFGGAGTHRVLYFWHRIGNGWLTLLSNMLTDLNVTDMETGYKAFTRDVFQLMHLTSRRFGLEPEIVARLSQMGARVYEVPISYHGRTYAEGKKITWRDGVAALFHILSARFTASAQRKLPPRPRRTPVSVKLMTAVRAPAVPASSRRDRVYR